MDPSFRWGDEVYASRGPSFRWGDEVYAPRGSSLRWGGGARNPSVDKHVGIASLSLGSVASERFAPAIRFFVHRVAKVNNFLPAGCGKRGWTPRIRGLAPTVQSQAVCKIGRSQ